MTPGSFREMFVTNNRRKSCLLPPAPGHALLPLLAHTQALAELLCAQDHLTSLARSHTQRNLNSSNAASTGPAQTEPPHAADSYQPALTASFAPIYERRSPRTATADRSRPEGPARTRCGELRGPPRRRRQLRATPSTSLSERPRTEAALRIALGRGTGRDEALPNRKDAAAPHSSRPPPPHLRPQRRARDALSGRFPPAAPLRGKPQDGRTDGRTDARGAARSRHSHDSPRDHPGDHLGGRGGGAFPQRAGPEWPRAAQPRPSRPSRRPNLAAPRMRTVPAEAERRGVSRGPPSVRGCAEGRGDGLVLGLPLPSSLLRAELSPCPQPSSLVR